MSTQLTIPAVTDAAVESQVRGNTAFALDLFQRLRQGGGNLFYSPYSISTALAMTYAGARGNTEAQMAGVLHIGLAQEALHPTFAALEAHVRSVQEQGQVALHVANSLWSAPGEPFLPEYLDLVRRFYGATITSLGPDPLSQVNGWVERQTNDKIKDLLKPLHFVPRPVLLLVNAIYFKGNWAAQFDAAATDEGPFWLAPGEAVEVPLMSQKDHFGYGRYDGLQVLELPYEGGDLSMVVLLPDQIDGLAGLEAALSVENLARWTGRLRPMEVEVVLPRFKLTGEFELGSTLAAMGMPDAFIDGIANFSGMNGRAPDLLISHVVHKAFVEVNEEGTEAAAATVVQTGATGGGCVPDIGKTITLRLDHPFLFFVRDLKTGAILFMGRVVDPSVGR